MVDQTAIIPKGWKMTTLGEVAEKIVDNRGKTPPITNFGFELLEVNAISENQRTPEYSKVTKFVEKETFNNWFRTGNISENDILIPTVGTIGNVSFSKLSRGAIAQNLIAFRTDRNKAEPLLVYYLLKTPYYKNQLLKLDIGGVQPSIKVPHLLGLEINLPPLPEQHAIASVLSSLDDKIELLREQNKTLEATAQAIFKEWFVNFNFPGAIGKLIDSELGEIPEGWKIGKIKDEIKTILGGTPSRANNSFWDAGSIPWINSGAINNFPIMRASEYITKEGLKNSAAKLMPAKTVVLPFVITPGSEIRISFLGIESSGNQSVLGLLETEKFSCGYIYFWIQQMKNKLYSGATGGAQQHINKQEVENLELLIPTHKVLESFNTLSYPIIEKIIENSFQIQTLSTLRDTLLPKLMKGEVRVAGFND